MKMNPAKIVGLVRFLHRTEETKKALALKFKPVQAPSRAAIKSGLYS